MLPLLHDLLVREIPRDFMIYSDQLRFRSYGSVMSIQAYYVGEVEYHLLQYIVGQLRPGFVMFDVGAHHGVFTLVSAFELRRRGWEGVIHSFEPDPRNFELLEYNVQQNDLGRYVVLHREAVGEVNGRLKLVIDEKDNSGNYLEAAATGPRIGDQEDLREVEVTTLDCFIDQVQTVHLIKLDIQGAEPLALAGGRNLISRFRPILVVEAVLNWPGTDRIREMLLHNEYNIHGIDAFGLLCPVHSKRAFVSWDWVGVPR
jgi:FkbM family methyltransferase